jgi:hypothetical protein
VKIPPPSLLKKWKDIKQRKFEIDFNGNGEMLDNYLRHFWITDFDRTFYAPSNTGSILARRLGNLLDTLREFPLP